MTRISSLNTFPLLLAGKILNLAESLLPSRYFPLSLFIQYLLSNQVSYTITFPQTVEILLLLHSAQLKIPLDFILFVFLINISYKSRNIIDDINFTTPLYGGRYFPNGMW